MTTRIVQGMTTWSGGVADDGYTTYNLTIQVRGDRGDGPDTALNTIGLPRNGDSWEYGNDFNYWVQCTPWRDVKPLGSKGPNTEWEVHFKFTNKPPETQRCKDTKIENPLMEPMDISGAFNRYTEAGVVDRFGFPITSSSWEFFKGQQNEWDHNRPTVKIKQNVLALEVELFSWMVDCVNDRAMWGLPARCVKLDNVVWEYKYYGSCFRYYTRTFEFSLNRRTWDRNLMDEGTKVLNGHWTRNRHWHLDTVNGQPPDHFNPSHFIAFPDFKGNPINGVLNGFGLPAGACIEGLDPANTTSVPNYLYIHTGGNSIGAESTVGIKVTNRQYWIPVLGVTPFLWSTTFAYKRGDIVFRNSVYYLATAKSVGDDPATSQGNWVTCVSGINNKGTYSNSTTYTRGDYVSLPVATGTGSGPCVQTVVGFRHTEKYDQVNMFLLGIPAIIGH